jgi:hypothetical protein
MESACRCYVKDTKCVTRCIAGETIVVPVRDHVGDLDSIYTLNEVGSTIWKLIDGRTSTSRIVEAICEEYHVEKLQAEQDTASFLDDLTQMGLIHRSTEERGRRLQETPSGR